jgi:hypothetical protein
MLFLILDLFSQVEKNLELCLKKFAYFILIGLMFALPIRIATAATDIISEYTEGSSNNKA